MISILQPGITICLAAQFEVWARNFTFWSDHFRVGLEEYQYAAGFVEVGPVTTFQVINFPLPGGPIKDFTSMVSFCLSVDKQQQQGKISFMINGRLAFSELLSSINTSFIPQGNASVRS